MKYFFNAVIVSCSLLLTISCANNPNKKSNDDENDQYEYVMVSQELIKELGGDDALSQYQFFLSDGITLIRVDNDKSAKKDGAIRDIDHNYSIDFTAKTPGTFRRLYTDTGISANFQTVMMSFIEIYFDEGDEDYLTFYSPYNSYDKFILYPIMRGLPETFVYKKHNWHIKDYQTKKGPKGPIYLLLQIDHSKTYKI